MQNTSITQFSTVNLDGWEKYLPKGKNLEHFHIFHISNEKSRKSIFLPISSEIPETTGLSIVLRPIYNKIITKHTGLFGSSNILGLHKSILKEAKELNENSDLKVIEEIKQKVNDNIAKLQKLKNIFESGDENDYISEKIIGYIFEKNIHKNHEFFKDIPNEEKEYFLNAKLVYLGQLDYKQSREKYEGIKYMVLQEICNDTDKKWCDRCEKYVSKKNWSSHIKRDIHINGPIRQKGVRKYKCPCGSEITNEKTVITRHNKTKKHLAYISN